MTIGDSRLGALCELGVRIGAVVSLDEVVDVALLGLDELLGHRHSLLLVHQVESDRLVTLASRGYGNGGIGSEVPLGEGVIGLAGRRRVPMRIGNLQRMLAYARTVQRVAHDGLTLDTEIRLPGLPGARSQLAAPMIARGILIGVVAVESEEALCFDEIDEKILTVAAHLVGAALDGEQLAAGDPETATVPMIEVSSKPSPPLGAEAEGKSAVRLRHYVVDGSTFLDDVYVIKGVAGRLLWKVVSEYVNTGRTAFTNREARLDPALDLPTIRDNFESRLILLKRRLDERNSPFHITSCGRGRFELQLDAPIALERIETL